VSITGAGTTLFTDREVVSSLTTINQGLLQFCVRYITYFTLCPLGIYNR